ncbi:MAG: NAD-dependent epimerase/dehydratase family protein [Ruminococcaceae bacterium]|nr:NAD-dependent epimerase/dehydratase family protein [Oscillospiraceae bacterium]
MGNKISLVTGATGHIGYALLKELVDSGEKVRILIRKDSKQFDGIECEKVYGDVTDLDALLKAFEGVDVVYHLAGIIDINADQEDMIWSVNVGGTKNVVKACQEKGVRRLIYASSVDAFPPLPDNQLMTELDHFEVDILDGTYAKTKATATQFVLDEVKAGRLDAVVTHPGACIGPYDFKVSNVGEMVRMFVNGMFPVTLSFGAYNFVDIRDVAHGMYMAAKQGGKGECYILCGEQISVADFIAVTAKACGKKAPKIPLSYGFAKAVAPAAEIFYKVAKKTPLFTRYSIRKLVSNCNFSIEKARKELDYNPMTVEQSVTDMVKWIRENEK